MLLHNSISSRFCMRRSMMRWWNAWRRPTLRSKLETHWKVPHRPQIAFPMWTTPNVAFVFRGHPVRPHALKAGNWGLQISCWGCQTARRQDWMRRQGHWSRGQLCGAYNCDRAASWCRNRAQGDFCPDCLCAEDKECGRGYPVEQRGQTGSFLVHLHSWRSEALPVDGVRVLWSLSAISCGHFLFCIAGPRDQIVALSMWISPQVELKLEVPLVSILFIPIDFFYMILEIAVCGTRSCVVPTVSLKLFLPTYNCCLYCRWWKTYWRGSGVWKRLMEAVHEEIHMVSPFLMTFDLGK